MADKKPAGAGYLISEAAYSRRYSFGASQIFSHVRSDKTTKAMTEYRNIMVPKNTEEALIVPSLSQTNVGLYFGFPRSHEYPSSP
jgi:hypothetical protein